MKLLHTLCFYVVSTALVQQALLFKTPSDEVAGKEQPNRDPHKIGSLMAEIDAHPDLTVASKLIHDRPALVNALNGAAADLTVFVPTDAAFNHVPHDVPFEETTEILMYHLTEGARNTTKLNSGLLLETAFIADGLGAHGQKIKVTTSHGIIQLNYRALIVEGDIQATNGVIQTIDQILIPPGNIMREITKEFRTFGGFGLAIHRTGLSSMFKTLKSTTIIAPNNEAFRKLGAKKLAHLFGPLGRAQLTVIVLGSIIPELLYSPTIKKRGEFSVPTLNGVLEFKTKNGMVFKINQIKVNDMAFIDEPDVLASNAVLHGIDTVLEHPLFKEFKEQFHYGEDETAFAYHDTDWYEIFYNF